MTAFATWSVNHDKKLIQVVVRVDLFMKEGGDPPTLMKTLITKNIPAIERKWQGKFKCYEFRLKVDWRWVKSRAEVRADAVDAMVDDSMGFGQTASPGAARRDLKKAMSEDPADVVEVVRSTEKNVTIWPPTVDLISHEVGHVLGLEDGYVESTNFWGFKTGAREPLPGHSPDVMQDPKLPVLPSTIARAVRRHYGPGFEDGMKCPIGVRMGPSTLDMLLVSMSNVTMDAKAPNYDAPSDDPAYKAKPAKFKGRFKASGEALTRVPFPLSASGATDVEVSFQLDLSKNPTALHIDLGFWVLTQTLRWDAGSSLPYTDGPLIINANGAQLDSGMFFPGPPLYAEFYDPDKAQQ